MIAREKNRLATLKRWRMIYILFLLAVVLANFLKITPSAFEQKTFDNRFNVVFVLDASNSMRFTDPEGYRYEAISQFIGLLADEGNALGGVVFSTYVVNEKSLLKVNSVTDKQSYIDFFSGSGTFEYTNIGLGLTNALNQTRLTNDENTKSVVVLLSDGNTEMPTDQELTTSLELKAAAIEDARQRGIPIYSVCLNANGLADINEMRQISNATNGVFREVKDALGLKDVFSDFYNLIYGTSTVTLVDEVYPASGEIITPFSIPGIGVEEVNIVINGQTQAIVVNRPDGTVPSGDQMSLSQSRTFTIAKIKNVVPGNWSITTRGVPGDSVRINMVYNTNLTLLATLTPTESVYEVNNLPLFSVKLASNDKVATTNDQYNGFTATLHVMDVQGNVLHSENMDLLQGNFEKQLNLTEGVYAIKAIVDGYQMHKESEVLGPIQIVPEAIPDPPENEPPVAIDNPITHTIYEWPFFATDSTLKIDIKSLANDPEGEPLTFRLLSSSFMEGSDYIVEDGVIIQSGYSLSQGSYEIEAMDPLGLTTRINVKVRVINVGILALILLSAGVLIVLAVIGIVTWIALSKSFLAGSITIQISDKGIYSEKKILKPRRGRVPLSKFGLPIYEINANKSYFQATGEPRIILKTSKPVYSGGREINEVQIYSLKEANIWLDKEGNRKLYVNFSCKVTSQASRPGLSHRGTVKKARSSQRIKPTSIRKKK